MFDVEKIRKDFPMINNNQNLIYFDSAATSFKPMSVIQSITDYYYKYNSNIHRGDYDISFSASNAYDQTRKIVSNFINASDSSEIVFTSGATMSLNIVSYGFVVNNLKKGDVILTTEAEHASNILPLFDVCKRIGAIIKYIPLNKDSSFNLDEYQKCFESNDVKFVSLNYVSNVMGYVNPIKEITNIAHKHGAIVSIDGAQAVPHFKVDVKDLDIDFLSFSSHKMCGPAGVGILYGKTELLKNTKPLFMGGGANARFDNCGNIILKNIPERFEAGTPNIEGIIGFAEAIRYLNSIGIVEIENYCKELTEYFISKMINLNNVELYNANSKSGIVTFNIKGVFAQDAASYFNKKNIAVRTGNHCAKILNNVIGVSDTIRASLYFYNTKKEIDDFINVIKETTLEKSIESVL